MRTSPRTARVATLLALAGAIAFVPGALAFAESYRGPVPGTKPKSFQKEQTMRYLQSKRLSTTKYSDPKACNMRCLGWPANYNCPPGPKKVKEACCKKTCG